MRLNCRSYRENRSTFLCVRYHDAFHDFVWLKVILCCVQEKLGFDLTLDQGIFKPLMLVDILNEAEPVLIFSGGGEAGFTA